MQKTAMLLPYEFEPIFKSIPLEQAGLLILALYQYEHEEIEPDFSDNEILQFSWKTHIKPKVDEYKEKYKKTCEARREAGSKGGKSNQEKQKQAKQANATFDKQNEQKVANQADIDKDIDVDVDINKKEKPNKKEKDEKNQEGWEDVFEAYEQRFPMTLSSYKAQQLKDIITNYGKEPVLYAIREASTGNAKQPIAYIRTVAMNYSRQKENDEKTEPKRESLEEIGKRIKEETEKARAEGKSMTYEEMKKKVIEEMKRKGMKIVGNSTPA